jgi:mediator of DNA damage checkpoint protein 1
MSNQLRIAYHNTQEITVTNYTGDARDYLKKLIGLMGATFTPSMSGKNTVVIAALYDIQCVIFPWSY